jgi:hypothetical protein
MTPLEIAAKAYNNETLFWSVRVAKAGGISRLYRGADVVAEFGAAEEASLALCERRHHASMRAALLALAEAELPHRMQDDRGWAVYPHERDGMYRDVFRIMLRAIAEETPNDA